MQEMKQMRANRRRARVERGILKKESQVKERWVLEIYNKHDPPGKYNSSIFRGFTHLSYIPQINNFLREALLFKALIKEEDHNWDLIIMSMHLTQKYFLKILNYTITSRRSILLTTNIMSTQFRVKFSIKSLVSKAHYFK